MKRERIWILPLCALAAVLTLTVVEAEAAPYVWESSGWSGTERTAAVMTIPQTQGAHDKYMSGDGLGLFHPEKALTRGELAQMLYEIVADRPVSVPALYDVPGDAWYAQAAETAAGLGLMIDDYGAFRPSDPVTRAECAYALSQLLPYDAPLVDAFYDVWPGFWAYQAICRTAGQGLFVGDGTGEFRPNDVLRRCEAAVVFDRLLGRSPDLAYLQAQGSPAPFADVPPSHWAYGEIMEAAVSHRYVSGWDGGEVWVATDAMEGPVTPVLPVRPAIPVEPVVPVPVAPELPVLPVEPAPPVETMAEPARAGEAAGLPDGPQRIDGHLYWVVDGKFARGHGMEGLWFNDQGWYTTGDEELDAMLNEIVDRLTNESMTRDQKLRALYDYVRDNFTYLKRPLIGKGQTGWEAEYAKYFLTHGKGNCYNFSATYALLCRELGLPAYIVVGSVLNSPHGWVEIQLDGATYMFDTQLEWRYLHQYKKTGYDLFKMSPSRTPFKYTR